jgi:hypothetical protein
VGNRSDTGPFGVSDASSPAAITPLNTRRAVDCRARAQGVAQLCRGCGELGHDIGDGFRDLFEARGLDALNAFNFVVFGRFFGYHNHMNIQEQ